MHHVCRQEVLMPGGVELTQQAEHHLSLSPDTRVLSVACGTGELECNLAEKYSCPVVGIDITERFIERARKKASARGLEGLAQSKIGDGNSIEFDKETFDRVFCSGGLCDFFDRGLAEFHRVLKQGGKAAIIDVVWKNEQVPIDVKQCWTGETSKVQTLEGDCQTFTSRGFKVLFAREYDEPSWWEAYYDDMGDAPNWQRERANYRAHKDYLALGLVIIEKV